MKITMKTQAVIIITMTITFIMLCIGQCEAVAVGGHSIDIINKKRVVAIRISKLLQSISKRRKYLKVIKDNWLGAIIYRTFFKAL